MKGLVLKINDRINIRTIQFFNNFTLDLKYDSIASAFAFSFYFDPNDPAQAELACVSHFHEAQVYYNDQLLINGYILSETFTSAPQKELVSFTGYSLPGALGDCQIPPSLYPLQSDGLSLRQIATRLLAPFKLKIVVDDSVSSKMDIAYETTTAKETQTIADYLTELAAQRNIVLSHDPVGNLLFTSAKTNLTPILSFDSSLGNSIPYTKMNMSFSGQQIHSEITVIKQASKDGGNAGQATVINPYVPIVYRPKVIVQSSGDDNSTQEAAMNALTEELKNISLTIETDRWEVDGKLITPNNIITVVNPDLYLYKKVNWFIEQIKFVGDASKTTATLKCVIPEVYNNKMPENIFVDKHKNTGLI